MPRGKSWGPVSAGRIAGLMASGMPALAMQVGAPTGARDAYAKLKPMIAGPFEPTWESLRDNWRVPAWFNEAKFGIFRM